MKYFNDITLGQYVERNSCLHQLDAKLKLGLLTLIMVYVMLGTTLFDYLILSSFLVTLVILGKLPIRRVLRGIKPIIYLAVLTLVLHTLLTPERDSSIWFISYSTQGFTEGLKVSFRLFLLIFAATLLTLTTKPLELTLALKKILSPFQRFGLPAYELSMMMMISLRFIPVIGEEAGRLIIAQRSRGGDFKSRKLRGKMTIINNTITSLFLRVFQRANTVAVAMESRGYPGVKNQAELYPSKFDFRDFVALLIVIAFGCLMFML